MQHTMSSKSIACRRSVKCGVCESIRLGTRAGSGPECARRKSSVVSLGTNDLVRVSMSHVPQQGFVNIADSLAFLTRRTSRDQTLATGSTLRHFLKRSSQGCSKKCDHDRLRKGARLVTYCSRMKHSKLCTFTLSQAQRLATCKSCVISDGER